MILWKRLPLHFIADPPILRKQQQEITWSTVSSSNLIVVLILSQCSGFQPLANLRLIVHIFILPLHQFLTPQYLHYLKNATHFNLLCPPINDVNLKCKPFRSIAPLPTIRNVRVSFKTTERYIRITEKSCWVCFGFLISCHIGHNISYTLSLFLLEVL